MRWQRKVFIPILAVLILSVVTIYAVLRSLDIDETQWILVAVCFAILLCFVLLSVLLVLIERSTPGAGLRFKNSLPLQRLTKALQSRPSFRRTNGPVHEVLLVLDAQSEPNGGTRTGLLPGTMSRNMPKM
jgi:hypothetical protein